VQHVPSDGLFIFVGQPISSEADGPDIILEHQRTITMTSRHTRNGGEEGDVMAWMVAGDDAHFMEDNQESFEEEEPVTIALTPGESMVDGRQQENPSPQ
jgi:hypothetical protein